MFISLKNKLFGLRGRNVTKNNFDYKNSVFFIFYFKIILMFIAHRKDVEVSQLNAKLESEQNLIAQLQKKIKELLVCTASLTSYFITIDSIY